MRHERIFAGILVSAMTLIVLGAGCGGREDEIPVSPETTVSQETNFENPEILSDGIGGAINDLEILNSVP
jgi:hypothetical protein